MIERLVQNAAYELGMDPAEFRRKNFIEQGPVPVPERPPGSSTTRATTTARWTSRSRRSATSTSARSRPRRGAQGRLLGIGLASFTEVVGAGPHKDYDILGLKMNDGAELRIHPTGKAILKISSKTQGQGHETTFAQIVAEEIGIQPEDIKVMHGDTDNTPYGLGHVRVAVDADGRGGDGDGGSQAPRQGPQARGAPARGLRGRRRVREGPVHREGRARQGEDDPGRARSPRTRTSPTGWSRAWRASPTTTRRTSRSRSARTRSSSRSTPTPACGRSTAWSRSTTAACGSTR